ncbi:ribosome biogenesis GTP-binding protein YihA/YsxC [Oleiagrimonas sp. C23AA]|uniref:ribosome biogenesis GTP-binding protein YihA/YsxC n=1 Tax=Oleiagrimonas sp. C23AA TaxID=2719047 RepID=UPI00142317EA|nr:ribosome biogenesis GTP-binding protein YihA/YsxC [Oleiagrimonas sp. C23AA]NII11402.1 YihA family ribosome biogenesis GTP-binding protein [Oleiagrimonas sp. C23AA]
MSANPLQRAEFVLAAHRIHQLPDDVGAEVAFAGRSNAGKSSALNTLTGRNGLARTSKTPGRTQLMVAFELDESTRLIDLPGYGYAKVPEAMREHWRHEIDAYLHRRRSLRGVVLLADIRHELKEFDRTMLTFCHEIGLPCHLLLTKSDKLSRGAVAKSVEAVRKLARQQGWSATMQAFSSHDGTGVESARETVLGLLAGEPRPAL